MLCLFGRSINVFDVDLLLCIYISKQEGKMALDCSPEFLRGP